MGPSETIHIPPREGRAVSVAKGDSFRVIDVEGKQVADMFAFSAADVTEHQSAMHTRAGVSRLFPREGEAFMSNRRRPMLTLVSDGGTKPRLCRK